MEITEENLVRIAEYKTAHKQAMAITVSKELNIPLDQVDSVLKEFYIVKLKDWNKGKAGASRKGRKKLVL